VNSKERRSENVDAFDDGKKQQQQFASQTNKKFISLVALCRDEHTQKESAHTHS
jgi:hypothetical protein